MNHYSNQLKTLHVGGQYNNNNTKLQLKFEVNRTDSFIDINKFLTIFLVKIDDFDNIAFLRFL